jgi:hypothetical protein
MMEALKQKYNSKTVNSLNKLLDLQTLIKAESSSKELCKLFT